MFRLDDRLGQEAVLFTRAPFVGTVAGVRMLDLGAKALAPFRTALTAWLDRHQAEAVLVRPDRYVFGSGPPRTLLGAWQRSLDPAAAARAEGVAIQRRWNPPIPEPRGPRRP